MTEQMPDDTPMDFESIDDWTDVDPNAPTLVTLSEEAIDLLDDYDPTDSSPILDENGDEELLTAVVEWERVEVWGRKAGTDDDFRLLTSAAAGETLAVTDGLPQGETWEIRARAVAADGRTSEWSAVEEVALPEDTTPPPSPSDPNVTHSFGVVHVRWDGKTEDDGAMPATFAYVRIEARMQGETEWEIEGTFLQAGTFSLPGLPAGTAEVRLTTVNTAGFASEASAVKTVVVEPIESAEAVRAELEAATAQAEADLALLDQSLRDAFGSADAAILSTANSTAEAKANAARVAAIEAAAADATAKAETAESNAAAAALIIAQQEALREAQEAEQAAKDYADLVATGAGGDTLAEAKLYAEQQAEEARIAAEAAAALDATAKAEAAEAAAAIEAARVAQEKANAALDAAKLDATGKANAAASAAIAAAASDAQTKFDVAKGAADAAAAAASSAAGVAAGKADVLIQSTAPVAAMRKASTLWIDTTGGNNTPKRWTTGTTWVAVTDKKATDAATAATNAATAASNAASAAAAAHTLAGTAEANAAIAFTRASDAETNAKSYADDAATAAQTAAETAAAADATAKAATAKAEALSAAATTAQQKADAAAATAKAEALSAAATDAAAKAATAKTEAIAAASTDATTKANNAKSQAISAAATDATTKANNAKTAAEAAAAADATAKAATAKAEALTAAATDAQSKANAAAATAKAEALTAAATDAANKAATAKSEAIAAAAADATTKANNAKTSAEATANALPKVLHGTGAPSGTAPDGSIWWQHLTNLQGKVIAQWNRVAGAWVSTPIDSAAIANLDVGKLTAGSLDVGVAVTAKLIANEAIISRLTAEQAWIGGVMLENGAVTLEKMNFVKEGSKSRLLINNNGLLIESARGDGAEIFKIDGESAATLSIFSPSGESLASIGEDGTVSGKINAPESILYRGDELSDTLDAIPKLLVRTQRTSATGVRSSSASTHNQSVMRLDFMAKPGMLYVIRAEGLTATSAGVNTRARWRLNGEANASGMIYATPNSSTWQEIVSGARPSAANALPAVNLVRHLPNTNEDRFVSVLVTYSAYGGADAVTLSASTTSPLTMEVWEHPPTDITGFAGYLGTTASSGTDTDAQAPAPVRRTKTYTATGTRSWTGGGSIRASNGQLWQGYTSYYPSGGRSESMAVFGTGIQSDLADSTVNKVEVFVHFDHWHSASGGRASIAWHAHSGLVTNPTIGNPTSEHAMARGEGKWITIPNSSGVYAGLQGGTFRGFALKAPNDSSLYYGTASGSLGNWKTPKLRITYTK